MSTLGPSRCPRSAAPLLILAIETAGSLCSVAIGRDDDLLAEECRAVRHGHAEVVLPMIDRVTRAAGVASDDLDAVAVATGPGGFTGIRVGLAAAHGIALATKVPLLGVTAFEAVAARVAAGSDGLREVLLVALDSRRAELYVQLFAHDPFVSMAPPAAVLPEDLAAYVAAHVDEVSLAIAGDAADAAKLALTKHPDARSIADSAPSARGVLLAARGRSEVEGPKARPFYLRPADVTMPKRRLPGVANTA